MTTTNSHICSTVEVQLEAAELIQRKKKKEIDGQMSFPEVKRLMRSKGLEVSDGMLRRILKHKGVRLHRGHGGNLDRVRAVAAAMTVLMETQKKVLKEWGSAIPDELERAHDDMRMLSRGQAIAKED